MDQIETNRLIIRSFTEEYLSDCYVSWLNDKNTMKYSDQRFTKHTLKTCRSYWQSFKGSKNKFWAIVKKDTPQNQHIGNITTYADSIHGTVDISIMIGEKSATGKGFGLEAWLGICEYLQKAQKVRKITAGTLEVNKPMLAIMKRTGMIEDGIRINHCIFQGRPVNMVHYALFAD